MRYEWDDNKYEENKDKHGVRFEDAQDVFAGYGAIETKDTIDGEEVIRIISARTAVKRERNAY